MCLYFSFRRTFFNQTAFRLRQHRRIAACRAVSPWSPARGWILMTAHSYVECTASCLAALCEFRRLPPTLSTSAMELSVHRGMSWLRRGQRPDGSRPGFWGVHFDYGTLFGIRGLLAAGARSDDWAIRKACDWLVSRQRPDGGWGEHFRGCLIGQYVEHGESQVIHTAWALIALLEAQALQRDTIERRIRFLSDMQSENWS